MSYLTQDHVRYTRGKQSVLKTFLFNPGFRFMVVVRGCQRFGKFHPAGILFRLWFRRLRVKYGYQVPFSTKIGAGLFLGHFGSIVVNKGTVIGRNCNLAQGVTIGQVNRGKQQGCPVIGDRVWIGANAVVVGGITIGNDVLIAPLTFVNFDVPDKAVVVGNPGQIINYNGSEGYVNDLVL